MGAFGLDRQARYPSTVDLCGIIKALLEDNDRDDRSGHDLLIKIANKNNLAHITEYIRQKLTDSVARIIYACLHRYPERIPEFIKGAILNTDKIQESKKIKGRAKFGTGTLLTVNRFSLNDPVGGLIGAALAAETATGANIYENQAVDSSEGLQLARRIYKGWFRDFVNFAPRPVSNIVRLLQLLQQRSIGARRWLSINEFIYGDTPMREDLDRSLSTFRANSDCGQRVLIFMSDSHATDGNPNEIATELHSEGIVIASIYLTSDHNVAQRRLYDKPAYF